MTSDVSQRVTTAMGKENCNHYGPREIGLLFSRDPEIGQALMDEAKRQRDTIELIASENYVSPAVLAAQGSVLTNKYAEGYPGRRYYGGCKFVDVAERLAIARAKQLFGAEHANVQPHSGSQANAAAYWAVLEPGDTVMALSLAHGGHLTHGHGVNFSGKLYNFVHYGVDKETERINYDTLDKQAQKVRPRLIVAGASAYPRLFDFERLSQIAKRASAMLLVDMAHIAGLIAAGLHPSPIPHADIVTSTTHKTLRGPRGGLILCSKKHAKVIDRAVFPGIQGGPLMHVIAAKAVAFGEALRPEFRDYQQRVLDNAQALAQELQRQGLRLVSGGTDNHMLLVDVTPLDASGRQAEETLEQIGIACNKNQIPFDANPPRVCSGIRLGTSTVTTRGFGTEEMRLVAQIIAQALRQAQSESTLAELHAQVLDLCNRFPIPNQSEY